MTHFRRRTLLSRVGGAVLVGGLGSVAGCQAVRDLLGGDDLPGYARRLHRPPVAEVLEGVGADATTAFRFTHVEPGRLFDEREEFPAWRVERLEQGLGFDDWGIDADEIEAWTVASSEVEDGSGWLSTGVFRVEYDREDVLDRFEDPWTGEEYRGYELRLRDGFSTNAWAFADGRFVRARVPRGISDGTRFEPALERAVDVAEGREEGYVEEDDDARALVSALGEGILLNGRPVGPEGIGIDDTVAFGENRFEADPDLRSRFVVVFEDADAADADDVEEFSTVEEAYDDVVVEKRGRTVVATGEYDPPER